MLGGEGSKPAMNGTEARAVLSRPLVGVFRQTLLKHFFSSAEAFGW